MKIEEAHLDHKNELKERKMSAISTVFTLQLVAEHKQTKILYKTSHNYCVLDNTPFTD